jgi:hypothetical protein
MEQRRTIIGCSLAAWLALAGSGAGSRAALAADNSSSGGTKVYRWTDDKGIVHYGDSVPSEYSQSERAVLNNQGVEVGHVEGGMNPAQQAEANRQAVIAQQRAQHDQFLLATYLSTKDIEQLRDERTSLVEAQIKAAQVYIDNVNARLTVLEQRALRCKPYSDDAAARRMPDDLAEDLVHALNESRNQRQLLESKRREVADLQAQFNGDIERYRELTAKHN